MKDISKRVILNRVEIVGFQSEERKIDVTFSQGNVSIIFGENGCGKTTFLKILNGILKQDNTILYNEKIRHILIKYTLLEDSFLRHENKLKRSIIESQHEVVIRLNTSEEEFQYDWSKFNESYLVDTLSLSLGVERGITSSPLKINERDILDFLRHPKYRRALNSLDIRDFSEDLVRFLRNENNRRTYRYHKENELSLEDNHAYLQNVKIKNIEELLLEKYREARNIATEQIQKALFNTLSFIFNDSKDTKLLTKEVNFDKNFMNSLITNKNRIIEALDSDFNENSFKKQMIIKLKAIITIEDIPKVITNKLFYELISNMMNQLEVEKLLLNSINKFLKVFNEFLGESKELVITFDEVYININQQKHNVDILSSGERHAFTFLALIIVDGSRRDFIFIDEPEISLNVNWQRILMNLLSDLAPETQIIVASHSPMIAKNSPNALVELQPKYYNEY